MSIYFLSKMQEIGLNILQKKSIFMLGGNNNVNRFAETTYGAENEGRL